VAEGLEVHIAAIAARAPAADPAAIAAAARFVDQALAIYEAGRG
jgi:hypothetical protein